MLQSHMDQGSQEVRGTYLYTILLEERYVLDIGSIWNPDIGIFEILEVYGYPAVKVGALPNVLSPCYLSAAPIP